MWKYEGTVELVESEGFTGIALADGTTLARQLELALKLAPGKPVKVKIVVEPQRSRQETILDNAREFAEMLRQRNASADEIQQQLDYIAALEAAKNGDELNDVIAGRY